MKRFFPRIFLVIWLGAALTGASVTLIDAVANPPTAVEENHNLILEALKLEAIAAVKEASGGEDPEPLLAAFRERTGATIYLFRDDGALWAPKAPPDNVRELAARVRREGDTEERHYRSTLVGLTLPDSEYVAIGRILRTPPWARALGEDQPLIRIALLLLASGLLAFFLARYLVRPIESLRHATHRIAEGDLGARVSREIGDGVLEELGADFDRMAARLEALIDSKQRLLSDVSHELNSPLARLRVALELARKRSGEDAKKALDRIEREAERLGELVDEILTFNRLERTEVSRAPLDLTALVREVARDARFEASGAPASVEVGDLDEVRLAGDEVLLRRAVENVVRNGLRFTEAGTAVEIALKRGAEEATLTIRDHGPGVPEEALEEIFEPLFRVESHRGRATGGAGLGLAIAERAVQVHEGTIAAALAEGGGLEVTIRLPLEAEETELNA